MGLGVELDGNPGTPILEVICLNCWANCPLQSPAVFFFPLKFCCSQTCMLLSCHFTTLVLLESPHCELGLSSLNPFTRTQPLSTLKSRVLDSSAIFPVIIHHMCLMGVAVHSLGSRDQQVQAKWWTLLNFKNMGHTCFNNVFAFPFYLLLF